MSADDSPDFRAFKERYSYGADDHALHTHTPWGFYQDGWRDGRHEVFDALPHAAARTIQAEAALAAAEAQVARLRGALEWYADPANSDRGPNVIPYTMNISRDRGERARAALAPGEPSADPRDAEIARLTADLEEALAERNVLRAYAVEHRRCGPSAEPGAEE